MLSFVRLTPLLLLLGQLSAEAEKEPRKEDDQQCQVYLAVSSTSTATEPKLGLFAGVKFEENTQLGDTEVAIITFNMMANAMSEEDIGATEAEESPWLARVVEFWEQFIWTADSAGAQYELKPPGRAVSAVTGAGVMGGYNVKMTNAEWNHSAAYFRPALGEQPGKNHPGRGAYSPYFGITLKSKHDIPAGMEIFLDYGENYHVDEDDKEITREDYQKLDKVIAQISDFMNKFNDEMTPEAKMDIYQFLTRDVMKAAAGNDKAAIISQRLPQDPDDLHKVKEAGGAFAYFNSQVVRSPGFLRTKGLCMDNLKMGASTIANAGRGAFANRPIPKGGLVSPVPLVHIPERKVFDMHEIATGTDEDGEEVLYRASDKVTGKQLLWNYCFGHPESNMLFFPSGSVAAMINHNSKPNAKIVWSNHEIHHPEWFDLAPEDLMDEGYQYMGLMFEIVATEDIAEDEEVFIDYGEDWVKAWEAHAESWTKKVKSGEIDSKWPLRAVDLNEEYRRNPFKTPAELEAGPYPENVRLLCVLVLADFDENDEVRDYKHRTWADPAGRNMQYADLLFDCSVVDRVKVEAEGSPTPFNYTINSSDDEEDPIFVKNVPHHAILFVDNANTGDQFVKDPFRHYIGIPDDMFPRAWRYLVTKDGGATAEE